MIRRTFHPGMQIFLINGTFVIEIDQKNIGIRSIRIDPFCGYKPKVIAGFSDINLTISLIRSHPC
jgi:hypothetical protein